MNLTIRPVRAEDYAKLAACNRAAMPGTDDTAESLQQDDAQTSAVERWVAEVDGQVVGSASWFQLASRLHPQKFWMDGAVHPDYQGRGLGSALLSRVLEAIAAKDAISLRTFSREDYAASLRFLGNRGFVEAKRTWESFLDLRKLDLQPYEGWSERLAGLGIRLCALPDLQGVPRWQERLLQLYNAIQTDVPDIDQAAPVGLAYFEQHYLGATSFLPEGQFIALDGEEWVGLTTLWQGSEAALLNTGLTGVLPAYRRQGTALGLKLESLRWAKEQSITQVRTTNASTNRGMLAINERLGFVKRPAWIHLVRQF